MRKLTTQLPNSSFRYSSPTNFVVCWNGATFGAAQGALFNSWQAKDSAEELHWLERELMFIRAIEEKIAAYKSMLEAVSDPQL